MKPVRSQVIKWYFITMGTLLAIAPTLMVFAGGSHSD
jgi:hypothetical protein